MYRHLYILFLFLHNCYGVIYHMNDTEYKRMPPIYQIDDYEDCFISPNGVYCSIHFELVSDQPSELLRVIEEYSQHYVAHFNHSKLRYGVCVTENCRQILNEVDVSKYSLEGCLNNTLWENYKLKTVVQHYVCYNTSDNDSQIDTADVFVGLVLLSLVLLNILGTIYDGHSKNSAGKSLLLCFSLKRNWKRLTSAQDLEPQFQRFKGINAIRCIVMYGVILVHCFWSFLVAVKNSHDTEKIFNSLPLHLLVNGSTAIQIFLVISGLLLAYKIEIYSEKHSVTWRFIFKGIWIRYLRITPAYAVVIALTATWVKFLGPTALWEVSAEPSIMDCKDRWWMNLLYLNNYVYNSQCMLHGWYLALDMQLHSLGLVLCVFLTNTTRRKFVLSILLAIGLLLPGIHTYLRDLHALMVIMPPEARYLYETEPTFNEVYRATHTNIPGFIIGISLGYLIYKDQQKKIDIKKFIKFRFVYWTLFPLLIGIILSGSIFYQDAPQQPLYVRVLYATFVKPIFGFVVASFIYGMVFRIENIYSRFMEAEIWEIPSKLSFCVYIIHFLYIRVHVALYSHLLYITTYHIILISTFITSISLISAVPLWLFVEAPFVELTKYMTSSSSKKKTESLKKHEEEIDSNTSM